MRKWTFLFACFLALFLLIAGGCSPREELVAESPSVSPVPSEGVKVMFTTDPPAMGAVAAHSDRTEPSVSLHVEKDAYGEGDAQLSITIENNTADAAYVVLAPILETLQDGQWKEIPSNTGFCGTPDTLRAHDSRSDVLHLGMFDSIDAGECRLSFRLVDGRTYAETGRVSDTFTLLIPWTTPGEDFDGISMYAREESVSPTGCTLHLANNTDAEWRFGETFMLYRKDLFTWIAVKPLLEAPSFPIDEYALKANASSVEKIDWEWLYGKLPAGKYRIVTPVSCSGESVDLYADFFIE